jgi:hypothetical protein
MRPATLGLIAAAALFALPATGSAQDTAQAPAPAEFCFDGARRSKCRTFVIAEMQGVMRLAQTSRLVKWTDDPQYPAEPVSVWGEDADDALQWEVGLMHNVSERWALGGAARLGDGSTGALTGLTARARRWMSEEVAVDVSAGATFHTASSPGDYGRKAGFSGDARLNFSDDAYFGLRYEQLPIEGKSGPVGFDAGGQQRALSLLLGVGSEWAVAGTAALGLGLVLFLINGDFR